MFVISLQFDVKFTCSQAYLQTHTLLKIMRTHMHPSQMRTNILLKCAQTHILLKCAQRQTHILLKCGHMHPSQMHAHTHATQNAWIIIQ
jgi:hypothetical protein